MHTQKPKNKSSNTLKCHVRSPQTKNSEKRLQLELINIKNAIFESVKTHKLPKSTSKPKFQKKNGHIRRPQMKKKS